MDERRKTAENAVRASAAPNTQRRPARAELIWDGKYDAAGRRVPPLRVALPFQTVETVNESAQERQRNLQYAPGFGEEEWRNRLIWGDKKYVLPSLLAEFAGRVNLIYIDPPFDTGADFSFTATVPEDPETLGDDRLRFTKEPSIIEHKAYRDIWGGANTHLDAYLKWFYETIVFLHELLHESGSIYVHLDWHVSFYCKAILDEIFGPDRFINEIIWKRQSAKHGAFGGLGQYGRIHETIFFYTKSENRTWNQLYTEHGDEYVEAFYKFEENDRRYQLDNLTGAGERHGQSGEPIVIKGERIRPAPGRHWAIGLKPGETVQDAVNRLMKEGRIWYERGKMPRYKRFLDEMPGVVLQDVWTDIMPVASQSGERQNYATQKPEALLDRILKASSVEGDVVFDCFVGSGTTAAAAEKLGRRWIACDLSRFAIHTTRKRLLSIPGVRPFVVENLGKYERQLWAGGEFGEGNGKKAAERQRAYIEFILKLANATPIHGYTWLHGVKAGRMIHVGAVDAPVSVGDVTQIATEFRRAVGTGKDAPTTNGVDVLGWDFAFELNEVAKQQAAAANIQMRFLRIPRDVMDKRAVDQGDIHFFELAALSVEVKTNRRNVSLKLKDFVIPPDDVPEEARRAVKHWSQWIDYWAVDWDNQGDTFHNEWQTYRTRKDKSLALEITHTYPDPGEYAIVVKVIDILGNDTTKTVKVGVA
jgi:adenine-specific DNA-methyltransferase